MPDASPAIIDLVQELIHMVRDIDPAWARVYLRFDISPGQHGCRASYTAGSNTMLVDTIRHKHAMHSLGAKAAAVFEALGKSQGVLLATSDSKLSYNIHFEYDDLGRWMISKLNGGTGVPAGFDPANPDNPAGKRRCCGRARVANILSLNLAVVSASRCPPQIAIRYAASKLWQLRKRSHDVRPLRWRPSSRLRRREGPALSCSRLTT